jgi:hypothetical protein
MYYDLEQHYCHGQMRVTRIITYFTIGVAFLTLACLFGQHNLTQYQSRIANHATGNQDTTRRCVAAATFSNK